MSVVTALSALGCDRGAPPIDLIALVPSAERRAAGAVDEAIRVDGDTLFLQAPARVTFALQIPARARLTAAAALAPAIGSERQGAALRVGISDDRRYEGLLQIALKAGVVEDVSVDLGAYGGWQWSVFYRPWERSWKVIVNADAAPGGTISLRRLRIVIE